MGFKARKPLKHKEPEYTTLVCPECEMVYEDYLVQALRLDEGDVVECSYCQTPLQIKVDLVGRIYAALFNGEW